MLYFLPFEKDSLGMIKRTRLGVQFINNHVSANPRKFYIIPVLMRNRGKK